MKKFFSIALLFIAITTKAQDVNVLFKEASNLEIQLKDQDALDKYKQILVIEPTNIKALVKATELSCMVGSHLINKNDKRLNYESALAYAQRAYKVDSTNSSANYAISVASARMTEVETENKKVAAFARDVKVYADRALAADPKNGKANFAVGRWHYEMVVLPVYKKAAVKVLYGGLPNASLDSAIFYMEKCKTLEPYFVLNYSFLAKAYREDNKPTKEIETLDKLIKLPVRTSDDAVLKAEGQKRREELQ